MRIPSLSKRGGKRRLHRLQVSILRRNGRHDINPRKQFMFDIIHLLRPYKQSNADIIIMGDFNETIGSTTNGLTQVLVEYNLTDVQAYRHGLENEQSTYARGPNRVDYILVSERILNHVVRQGWEPFNARIFSDHRGIFTDVSYPGFFDLSPNVLAPPSQRGLIYNRTKHVRKYLSWSTTTSSNESHRWLPAIGMTKRPKNLRKILPSDCLPLKTYAKTSIDPCGLVRFMMRC